MASAIASMIRRAASSSSSNALTLAIRASKTPKSFPTAAASFLPLSRFSTSAAVASENVARDADEELSRELKAEFYRAEDEPKNREFPGGFPFDINDTLVTRKFGDENILIDLDLSDYVEEKQEAEDSASSESETEEEEEANCEDEESESESEEEEEEEDHDEGSRIRMSVRISRGYPGEEVLKFEITAYPDDRIWIESVRNASLRGPYKFGEDNMKSDLRKAFHRYLEKRGIKPNFMRAYLHYKKNREYQDWLYSFRRFVDK